MSAYTHIYTYIHMYVYIHICICVYICGGCKYLDDQLTECVQLGSPTSPGPELLSPPSIQVMCTIAHVGFNFLIWDSSLLQLHRIEGSMLPDIELVEHYSAGRSLPSCGDYGVFRTFEF